MGSGNRPRSRHICRRTCELDCRLSTLVLRVREILWQKGPPGQGNAGRGATAQKDIIRIVNTTVRISYSFIDFLSPTFHRCSGLIHGSASLIRSGKICSNTSISLSDPRLVALQFPTCSRLQTPFSCPNDAFACLTPMYHTLPP